MQTKWIVSRQCPCSSVRNKYSLSSIWYGGASSRYLSTFNLVFLSGQVAHTNIVMSKNILKKLEKDFQKLWEPCLCKGATTKLSSDIGVSMKHFTYTHTDTWTQCYPPQLALCAPSKMNASGATSKDRTKGVRYLRCNIHCEDKTSQSFKYFS